MVHVYETSYKGFIFRTESKDLLDLPPCEYLEVAKLR